MNEIKSQHHGLVGLKDYTNEKSVSSEQSKQIRDSDKKCRNIKRNFETDMKQKKSQHHGLVGLKDYTIKKSVSFGQSKQIRDSDKWEIKKLEEIGKVSMCKRVFKEDTTPEGDIPFYKIGTFGKSPDAFITKAKYDEFRSKFSFPKKGDILISASGTIGRRVRYDGEPAYFQDSNIVWIDNDEKQVLNDYLYRFYEICNWKSTKGATISRLYNDNLKQIEIPFPKSLPEQQRIVSILDKAFAAIDKAKANAEQNLKNAKELFESYLQGVFENGNWETKKIQEVTKVINGYAFASKDFKPTNTIKSIKITNVGVKEFVEEADNYLPEKFKDTLKEVQVREGNIVIALTRTIISAGLKVAVVPESYDGALVNQRVAALMPKGNLINQKYVYYYLTTSGVAKYVLEHVNTLMQPNLSINDLKNMPIPCPNLKVQQTIVRQLDALRAETQKLEAVYQQKIANLEELKKSILQKAFAGELKTENAVAV
ncbi:MAG: restriction endonuclease subunit S [Bacteroidia bacterium]|nr:restriction endonuclease subunit S [Bacteroidia bacterium]